MKIHPVGYELFHADRQIEGQPDMTKLTVAFCNFSTFLKMLHFCTVHKTSYLLVRDDDKL
jgi:hypothetical protein